MGLFIVSFFFLGDSVFVGVGLLVGVVFVNECVVIGVVLGLFFLCLDVIDCSIYLVLV